MNVLYVTRYPWSIQFGGAELQAMEYLRGIESRTSWAAGFIDQYTRDFSADLLHIVGLNSATETIARSAVLRGARVVISPVFYLSERSFGSQRLMATVTGWRVPALRAYRDALLLADVVLPNSAAEAEQLVKFFRLSRAKVQVLRNGVGGDWFEPTFANRNDSIADDYALCVSMIESRKNTLNLIRCFCDDDIPLRLILVGDYRCSDQYREQVDALIEANPKVTLIPFTSDRRLLASLYRDAKLHVLPSSLETPGLSSLEALACGTKIVVGDCKPVREYFGDNATYVNGSSIASIRRGVRSALSSTRESHELVSYALKYKWDHVIDDLASIYCNVMGG